MHAREYYNTVVATQVRSNKDRRQLMLAGNFVSQQCPKGAKTNRLAKWCIEHLGYDNFVICHGTLFFDDTATSVQFKLSFSLSALDDR